MKRLTKRDADGQAMMDCQKCKADWTDKHGKPMVDCTALYCRNRLLDRVVEYEDTELTPEQCVNAKVIIESAFSDDTSKAELIRELLKADKDGRLVVLPCKVGDTAYWVHGAVITECRVHRIQKNRNGLYICLKSKKSHGAFRTDIFIGKTVFFTRKEAEKALSSSILSNRRR